LRFMAWARQNRGVGKLDKSGGLVKIPPVIAGTN